MKLIVDINHLEWRMTSDHDYLGASHRMWGDWASPFKFTVYFGESLTQKINTIETIEVNTFKTTIFSF